MSYLLTVGATYTGILTPEFQPVTLGMMALALAGWLFARWRGGWRWQRTALDTAFIVWGAAFAASLLANPEVGRRSAIGLWYVGVYIGVWYVLHDAVANGRLRRDTLVDGLLIGGVVVLLVGYIQLVTWGQHWLPLMRAGRASWALPRLVSTPGNANALGGFLVVLLPFAAGRFLAARTRVAQITLGLYTLLTLGLLFLTFSRGAWMGAAAGLGVLGWLGLAHYGLLSRAALLAWWRGRPRVAQLALTATTLAGIAALAVGLALFVRSFDEGGRSTDLRTYIWEAGITLFSEKPLTGHGLFTFGRGLARLASVPPSNPHSHAHDAPIHIAAELGLIGLAALAVSLWLIYRGFRANWRGAESTPQRLLLGSAAAAVVGFAIHQLTDVPAMMPMIALAGLVALVAGAAPVTAQPVPRRVVSRLGAWGTALLWLALLVSGVWSSGLYQAYVEGVRYGLTSGDYSGAAAQLEAVIQADPNLAFYSLEQGFLYGLAAAEGDEQAARAGMAAYERFIASEPGYALAWANLGGLYGQLGDDGRALTAAKRAAELAPESWQLAVNLARYAGAVGDTALVEQAYTQAIVALPDASLLPDLAGFVAGNPTIRDEYPLSVPSEVALLLENGQPDAAQARWDANPQAGSTQTAVISALLALAHGQPDAALDWLRTAETFSSKPEDPAWIALGQARYARSTGDYAGETAALRVAQAALTLDAGETDFAYGINIGYAQFLRLGIPRQFLPQVYYPAAPPVLLFLLGGDSVGMMPASSAG
jgi:putative inorganic carbon (HCO3(-)) transporter